MLYFYEDGSRRQEVLFDFLKTYKGTVQSDAYAPYRKLETDQYHNITRIACLQHVKRKFLEHDTFVPARLAGEMTSIGTLMAFTLVCAAVLVVRKTMPNIPRSFKTPFVPLVPILGILTCLCMMLFLPADTWIRLVLWMLIGLDIYVGYGMKHSKLEHGVKNRRGQSALNMIGIALSLLCVITGLWHQQTVWNSAASRRRAKF